MRQAWVILAFLCSSPAWAGGSLPHIQKNAPPALNSWEKTLISALTDFSPKEIQELHNPALSALSRLDFRKTENVSRLEPLINKLELSAPAWPLTSEEFRDLEPQARSHLLAQSAQTLANEDEAQANYILSLLDKQWLSTKELPLAYSHAERLVLIEAPYLAAKTLERLQQALPSLLLSLQKYRQAQREQAGERMQAMTERLENNSPSPDGGVAEPTPAQGINWDDTAGYDGFLKQGDGLHSGYDLLPDMHDAHKQRNTSPEPKPDKPKYKYQAQEYYYAPSTYFSWEGRNLRYQDPRFPLSLIWQKYLPMLEEAAQRSDAGEFWDIAASAFRNLKLYADKECLPVFRRIGRLGPSIRRTLDNLQFQVFELRENIQKLRDQYKIPDSFRGWFASRQEMSRLNQDYTRLLQSLQKARVRLTSKDRRLREDARAAFHDAQKFQQGKHGEAIAPLWVILRYYCWLVQRSRKDPDRAHWKEAYEQILSDKKSGIIDRYLPNFGDMLAIWASSYRSAGKLDLVPYSGWLVLLNQLAFFFGAGLAVLSFLKFPSAIPWIIGALIAIATTSAAAVFLLGLSRMYLKYRFLRLGRALKRLEQSLQQSSPRS